MGNCHLQKEKGVGHLAVSSLSGMEEEMRANKRSLALSLPLSLSYRVFPGGASGKEPTCQCRRLKRCGFNPWVGKIPWRREWQLTPVFLPREFHGQRSLVGYHLWQRVLDYTYTHCLPKMRKLFVIDSNKEKLQFWKSTAFSISKHTQVLSLILSLSHTHTYTHICEMEIK